MSLFKKRGADIDYTLLQKRGFIKKAKEKKLPFKVNSSGFIELIDESKVEQEMINSNNNSTQSDSNNVGMAANPFGFLDSVTSVNNNNNEQSYYNNANSNNSTNNSVSDDSSKEINSVKIKLDDLEFKLEKLLEKIALIETKLGNFEDKTK